MAICIYEYWTSIIVNVESINRCYEGGIIQFLIDRNPSEHTEQSKQFEQSEPPKHSGLICRIIYKIFNTKQEEAEQNKTKPAPQKPLIEDFDGIYNSSGDRVEGVSGCDGNLFYFSSGNEDAIDKLNSTLASFGLVSNVKSNNCDYYILTHKDFTANRKKLTDWLQIDFVEAADSSKDQSIQFAELSVFPFKMPYIPSKFEAHQGGFTYKTQKYWEESQKAIKENKPQVVFELSQISNRHLNASLWEEIPSLDSFVDAYLTGDKSNIPSNLWYIFDGSKENEDMKRRLILFDDSSKQSSNIQISSITNEQILHEFATAWRTLNPELIIQHLASEFQYDSMWVFESLDHDSYADYIKDKFNTIKRTSSQLKIEEIPEHNAIAIIQDEKDPVFYLIKIKDGKIVKGDLTAFLM